MTLNQPITHGLALIIGSLLMSAIGGRAPDHPHDPSQEKITTPRAHTRSHSQHTPSPNRQQTLLTELAHTPMDSRMRKRIKKQIFTEWAKTDPAGLLRYLDTRPWPDGSYLYGSPAEQAFKELAKTNPSFLLEYAQKNGCFTALSVLSRHGNPYGVLNLYLSQTPGTIPPDTFYKLFHSGTQIDPEFHQNILSIEDPKIRAQAFEGATTVLFKHQRYDEYFNTLKEIQLPHQSENLVNHFVDNLLSYEADANLIFRLPEELQKLAIEKTIGQAVYSSEHPNIYRQTLLNTYIENNWIGEHEKLAENLIVMSAFTFDSAAHKKNSWKDWALQLPENKQLEPLRDTAIRQWALVYPKQWRTIYELPTQAMRDIAYTAVLSNIDLENEADSISWIKDQIQDPALKTAAERALIDRKNDDAGDPFADDPDGVTPYDPYDPIAQ